jgi:soluble lytic murein transglycosylase-like protein
MTALNVYQVQAVYEPLCAQYEVDLGLMLAMVQRESNYDPNAVGTSGELGMAQLTRSAWITVWNAKADFQTEARVLTLNAETHIRYYLWGEGLIKSSGQLRTEWYVAAYNCGVGRVWGSKTFRDLPASTQGYVNDVMRYWEQHKVRLFAEATALDFAWKKQSWMI